MKKLFTLLAMVGLALASCTPNGEGTGNNGGSQAEFSFEITNIGEYGATVKVTPKDMERTYFTGVWSYVSMVQSGGANALMEAAYDYYKSEVEAGRESWLGGEYPLLTSGVDEGTLTTLNPGTKYVAMAFGVDANGNLTSTTPCWKEFLTLDSTFDTTQWQGEWILTPSKLLQELVNDTDWARVLVANEGNKTYTLEIVDGASEGSEWAGYALVYGWDANIPDIPALGQYAGNALELLNDEVVYIDANGNSLLWCAVVVDTSDATNMRFAGGVEGLIPYTLKMGEDGTVSVTGDKGLSDGVSSYNVEIFQLIWQVGDYVYPATQEDGLDEVISHPAGNTMTAIKAPATDDGGAVAPAKLSAKKNIKIMHKYANAKSAALQFSSAIKVAALAK